MVEARFGHTQSARRAREMDRRWFEKRPDTWLRLRNSLAFEWDSWDENGHKASPFVLVFLNPFDGSMRKRTFSAHQMPDRDQGTLAALWDWIDRNVPEVPGGRMVTLNPVQSMELAANVAALRMQLDTLASIGA